MRHRPVRDDAMRRAATHLRHVIRTYATKRSPYAVLGVDRGATEREIKTKFRALAKALHPDTRAPDAAGDLTEVLEAYASLTDRHFDVSDLVAASVEIFSVEELRADDRHDVHDVHLVLALDLLDGDGGAEVGSDEDETRALVEADGRVAIHCAEWDAISDVKRALEAQFSEAWDLVGRPRDRDGCFSGWELVSGETPLGPHFFVGDYGLKRGDVVHAVVRRRG